MKRVSVPVPHMYFHSLVSNNAGFAGIYRCMVVCLKKKKGGAGVGGGGRDEKRHPSVLFC